MKELRSLFLILALCFPVYAEAELPVLQRVTLSNKEMWQWETELVGHRERNGAVLECIAESITDLLRQAEMEPTVESLVHVLTTPCRDDTPQAEIKELLMPRTNQILVSQDATFAALVIRNSKTTTLEIFRDTAMGLTMQRLRR
jgi:hypothetical protein